MKFWETIKENECMTKQECQEMNSNRQVKTRSVASIKALVDSPVSKASTISLNKEDSSKVVLPSAIYSMSLKSSLVVVVDSNKEEEQEDLRLPRKEKT